MDLSLEVFHALIEARRRVWFIRGMASVKATRMIQHLANIESENINTGERLEQIVQGIEKWIQQETNRLRMGSDVDVENYVTIKTWMASNENPSPTAEAEWFKNWRLDPMMQTYRVEQPSELIIATNSLYGLLTNQKILNTESKERHIPEQSTSLTSIEKQRREWFRRGMVSEAASSMIDNLLHLENNPDAYNGVVEWIKGEKERLKGGTATDKVNLKAIVQWATTNVNPLPLYGLREREWFPKWISEEPETTHNTLEESAIHVPQNGAEPAAATSNIVTDSSVVDSSVVDSHKTALDRLIEIQRRDWFSRGMVSEMASSMIDNLILLEGTVESKNRISSSMRNSIHEWIEEEKQRLQSSSSPEDKENLKRVLQWAKQNINSNPLYYRISEWFNAWMPTSTEVEEGDPPPLAVGLTTDEEGRGYICAGDQMPDDFYSDIIEANRRIWFIRGLFGALNDYQIAYDFKNAQEYHESGPYSPLLRWAKKEAQRFKDGTRWDKQNLKRALQWQVDKTKRETKSGIIGDDLIHDKPETWYNDWKPSNLEYIRNVEEDLLKKHPDRPIIVPWRSASEPLILQSPTDTTMASTVDLSNNSDRRSARSSFSTIHQHSSNIVTPNNQASLFGPSRQASTIETTSTTTSRTLENTPLRSEEDASTAATPSATLMQRKRSASRATPTGATTKRGRLSRTK